MRNRKLMLIICCLIACKTTVTKKNPDARAIAKNNEATYLMVSGAHRDSIEEKVLALYNEAIRIDSSYYLAYVNKAQFLCESQRYPESIETLDSYLRIEPRNPNAYMFLGFMYLKSNDSLTAKRAFNQSLNLIEQRLKEEGSKVNLKMARASVLLYLDKSSALRALDEIAAEFGEETTKELEPLFEEFDLKAFLSNTCSPMQ